MARRRKRKQRRKQPAIETSIVPKDRKVPKAEEGRSYLGEQPVWRFSRFDVRGPFGFRPPTEKNALQLAERLKHFESMTWKEIFGAKKQNHSNAVDQLDPKAQKRLRELRQDDVDELHSLRLSGKERLYGVFVEGIYHVLWWDPDHQVCPSKKKHT